MEMVTAIREHNARGEKTVFICPVGPVGQYPIFVRLVNRERLSLKSCWFINMDEYLQEAGREVGGDFAIGGLPHHGAVPLPEHPQAHLPRP